MKALKVLLGATSGEIGTFLTSVGSLLVLWVGMWLVLKVNLHSDN